MNFRGVLRFALASTSAALALLAVTATPAFAREFHAFSTSFGKAGSGNGELALAEHSGVAVNSETDDVYVADTGNARIEEFSSTGAFIRTFGTLTDPTFIAVDNSTGASKGDVYVVDSADNTVSKFESDGTLISVWGNGGQLNGSTSPGGAFNEIDGIAINSSGELYVLCGNRMTTFTPSSSYTTEFSLEYGSVPIGIAVDDSDGSASGDIYKDDEYTPIVLQFGPSGGTYTNLLETTTPDALAVDSTNGDLYLAQANGEVAVFNSSFARLELFGLPEIGAATGLAVGPTHNVYVADTGDQRIDVFILEPGIALTVAKEGTGSGEVTSSPPGIQCGSSCTEDFKKGSKVTLTAAPAEHSAFAGWSGCTAEPIPTECEVDMGAAKSVTATFDPLPETTTGAAANPTRTTATLEGTVNPSGFELKECAFEYVTEAAFNETGFSNLSSGGTASCDQTSAQIGAGITPVDVSAEITSLKPQTVYRFRLAARNEFGTESDSAQAFETLPAVADLHTEPSTNIEPSIATLNASYTGNGERTEYYFEWGLTDSYGNHTPYQDAGSPTVHASLPATLEGLAPYTVYHYRVVAIDSLGTTIGPDQTFLTLPPNLPTVDGTSSSNLAPTTATLEAQINPGFGPTVVRFEYGTTTSYGSRTYPTEPIGSDNTDHLATTTISELSPATIYHFRVIATNLAGTTDGPDHTFNTIDIPAVSATAATAISQTTATLSAQVKPGFNPTTYHFEYGTKTSYGHSTPQSASIGSDDSTHPVSTPVAGLVPATTYHYRIVASNEIGTGEGPDQTFTTASPPEEMKVAPPPRCHKGFVLKHGKCARKPHRKAKHHQGGRK